MANAYNRVNFDSQNRIEWLDFLRFLAIVPVIMAHFNHERIPGGSLGVYVFFALSGFLIHSFLVQKNVKNISGLIIFWIRRIFRIYPLYFFCWTIGLLIFWFKDHDQVGAFWSVYLKTLSVFQLSNNGKMIGYLQGVLWTLHVEIVFYLIFPIFFMLVSKRFRILLPFIFAGALELAAAIVDKNDLQGIWPSFVLFLQFGKYLALGSLAAEASRYSDRVPVYVRGALSILGLVGILTLMMKIRVHENEHWFDWAFVVSALTCLLIWSAPFANLPRVFKPTVFVGQISYSVYLVHAMVLDFIRGPYGMNFLTFIVVTFLFSFLTYRLIEKTGIQLGRRVEQEIKSKPIIFRQESPA